MPDVLALFGDILEAAPREHAFRRIVHDARVGAALREGIVLLDQQPRLVAALAAVLAAVGLHQGPAAVEFLALELELEMALGIARDRVAFGNPCSAVPQQYRTGAVLLRGNDAFEGSVLDRMVFDVHRQALVGRVEAGPLGNGPAQQHTIELEPEIVVEMTGGVFLDDERQGPARASAHATAGFRSDLEVALFAVPFQGHGTCRSRVSKSAGGRIACALSALALGWR